MWPSNWPSSKFNVMKVSCKAQWIRPPLRGARSNSPRLFVLTSLSRCLISDCTITHWHLCLLLGPGEDWSGFGDEGVSSSPSTGSFSADSSFKAAARSSCCSSAAPEADVDILKNKRIIKRQRKKQKNKHTQNNGNNETTRQRRW